MTKNFLILTISIFITFSFINADRADKSKNNLLGDIQIQKLFTEYPLFKLRYENYVVTDQINLSDLDDISVVIMFGTWCHDSKREVPRMLRILDAAGLTLEKISLIGVDINKQEPNGRGKFYNLKNTPTLILLKNGKEVGRIIERPKISLEADLINLMTRSLEPVVED
tara:strand:- start:152 stop:655 length:504 start_codon:yes stop_codon:yes gene_type:complete